MLFRSEWSTTLCPVRYRTEDNGLEIIEPQDKIEGARIKCSIMSLVNLVTYELIQQNTINAADDAMPALRQSF